MMLWLREAGEDPGWTEYGPWWRGPRKRSRKVRIRETRERSRRRRALMRGRRAVLRGPVLPVAARKAVLDVHVYSDDFGSLSALFDCSCPACEIPF